jgi:glucose-6-phosphate isomerase
MAVTLRYDSTAADQLVDLTKKAELHGALEKARTETLADVDLLRSGDAIPEKKEPLDSGFIELPKETLAEFNADPENSLLGLMKAAAANLSDSVDQIVLLGIGGSYMGLRALFEALGNPFHNELSRDDRKGAPRIYYEGNNLDNDALDELLELLKARCQDTADILQRWGIVVVSKSGGTLETAVSFRLFQQALEDYYGADSDESRKYIVPVTGDVGKLRDLSNAKKYESVFPIPDGVGGRFSVFTPVGLFPALVLGLDVEQLLQGAADMTETFRTAPIGNNPVLDFVATCRLAEDEYDQNIRILSTWGKKLEAVGLWYDQLLAESIGKEEQGATPITGVNTRDLHSRGQQHQEGTRDKLITNVLVESSSRDKISIPERAGDQDQLNQIAGKTLPTLLSAAFQGTNKAYADADRPTADIRLPQLDAHTVGQLLQMLMLATVVEGRMMGINPYGQPGVEDYKNNMKEILGME